MSIIPSSPLSPSLPARGTGTPGRCFAYTREHEDASATAQAEAAADHFERVLQPRGFTWGGVFTDKACWAETRLLGRPAGTEMSVELEFGDVVLVPKMTASFADTDDVVSSLRSWVARGVGVCLVEQQLDLVGPDAEKALAMVAVVLGLQSAFHGARIKKSQVLRRSKGKPTGAIPYGLKTKGPKGSKRYVPDPATRAIGRRIVELRDGGESWKNIYFLLLRECVRLRSGKEVSIGTVQRFYAWEKELAQAEAEQAEAAP